MLLFYFRVSNQFFNEDAWEYKPVGGYMRWRIVSRLNGVMVARQG